MTELVLGLDQGTSSTRCLAFDRELSLRGSGAVPVAATFPAAGLVEQDPSELVSSASAAIEAALANAGASSEAVVALGISNQTETLIVSSSGEPIHPAIVWQDRRTADRCASLAAAGRADCVRARTGLELDATFPATKIGWVLDHVDGARAAAEAGELRYHDVAGWLIQQMGGGDLCEVSNAGRTLLCPLGGGDWDDELLELFDVPRAMLPQIVDSDAVSSPDARFPVTAALGDQQASLFGLGCVRPGMAKVTLGTGAFVLAHAGSDPPSPPPGVLTSCAWRRRGDTSFALEGFVPAAGAALDWFATLGALPPATALDALLASGGPGEASVLCVPALQGLGTPRWDAAATGVLLGFTRATTRAEIARAVVDGVLHQVADALEAIGGSITVDTVLLDGGMSRSDWIVQRLADLTGVRVERAARPEASATGAAMMAGLAAGVWNGMQDFPAVETDLAAEPSLAERARAALRNRWSEALTLTAGGRP